MSKAKDVLKVLEKVMGTPIGDVGSVKSGDWVVFKDEHSLAGTTGIVIQSHPDAGTLDLKVGKATKMGVPAADLLAMETPGTSDKGVGKDPTASTPGSKEGEQETY